ncbi:MAG: SDR family NAD(P)-dependent oxidoreductase [Microbacterium gubbeenense]
MNEQKTVAVILAGGVGTRVGLGMPKQLIKIAGKAIVEHTLENVHASDRIDEIIIMMHPESISDLEALLGSERFPKLTRVLPGGATRNDTTQLALDAIDGDETKVLFHDAVRPFIDEQIITSCVDALDSYDAVDTAIPSADTIIEIDEDGFISSIPPRSRLRRGQTPQAFRAGVIREAYRIADDDPDFAATDDCGVVFKYLPHVPIFVVDGTAENMKVTEPIDIAIADKIFQMQSASLTPTPLNIDLTGHVMVVFGGSYGIGSSIVDVAREAGATVHSFSRSQTGTDITRSKDVKAALRAAEAESGRIDSVVVTAGVLTVSPLADTRRKVIKNTLWTNLAGPANAARLALPYLRRSQGSLMFFTSSSYTRGRANYSLYSATKAGIVNLTQALAEEWSEDGVRVNCINPQRTLTPMRRQAFGQEPLSTLLAPEDVAHTTLRVLSTELTGQVVDVKVTPEHNASVERTR